MTQEHLPKAVSAPALYTTTSFRFCGKDDGNKGCAVRRLKGLFHPSTTIAAGDSVIDIPMLNEADLAIVPTGFQEIAVKVPFIRANQDEYHFSDFILKSVCMSL